LNFQAPRIEVRGFTRALRSCGRASGDDGGCGCAAGNGPAGACALTPVAQPAQTTPKPAAMQILKFLKFMVTISCARYFLVRSFRYQFPFSVAKVPGGLDLPQFAAD